MRGSESELPLGWIAERAGAQRAISGDAIQCLWSGYGEIRRVHLEGGPIESVVVKRVTPPEARRQRENDASHQRKLRSYAVVGAYPERPAARPTAISRVPRCLGTRRLSTPEGWLFVLEDLDASGFPERRRSVSESEIELCLTWLADFHAVFLGQPPTDLWKTGTYWHLATRRDELPAISDARLRRAAPTLDARLNACEFKTLVHGDAKLANFCFGQRGVAAVDFQYVGGGSGIKDVAYFFSSCWDAQECEARTPHTLELYFRILRARMAEQRPELDSATRARVEDEWRQLYPIAWADLCRFLAGWAPGHWQAYVDAGGLLRQTLDQL
jgi:hypothetical protein